MGYVIIDLEFNNAMEITKYFPEFYVENPNILNNECPNEIIQVGAVKLDKYLKELDRIMIYVKPNIFKVLNPRITEITGIEEGRLKDGVSFSDALEELKEFLGDEDILCSWAKDDIAEIIRNSNYHDIQDVQWIKQYIDLQEYCTKVLGERKTLSLKNALEKLKIKVEEEKLHDALNDSLYTAEVFRRIFNHRILKNYIVTDILNMPAIAIKNYENFKLEEDKIELICPKCSSEVNVEYPLKLFNWRFVSLCYCKRCRSRIINEITVRKTLTGQKVYKVNRSIVNEVEYLDYAYKYKDIG